MTTDNFLGPEHLSLLLAVMMGLQRLLNGYWCKDGQTLVYQLWPPCVDSGPMSLFSSIWTPDQWQGSQVLSPDTPNAQPLFVRVCGMCWFKICAFRATPGDPW